MTVKLTRSLQISFNFLVLGSSDFFGINHYSTSLVEHDESGDWPIPSRGNDLSVKLTDDPSWPGTPVTKVGLTF